jgi:hypothetical protein
VDGGPWLNWFTGGLGVARSDGGDSLAVFEGGTSVVEGEGQAAWRGEPVADVRDQNLTRRLLPLLHQTFPGSRHVA